MPHSATVSFDPACRKCWDELVRANWFWLALGIPVLLACFLVGQHRDAILGQFDLGPPRASSPTKERQSGLPQQRSGEESTSDGTPGTPDAAPGGSAPRDGAGTTGAGTPVKDGP